MEEASQRSERQSQNEMNLLLAPPTATYGREKKESTDQLFQLIFTVSSQNERVYFVDTCECKALTHFVPLNILRSRGSPVSSPSMVVREWQVAMPQTIGPGLRQQGSSTNGANLRKGNQNVHVCMCTFVLLSLSLVLFSTPLFPLHSLPPCLSFPPSPPSTHICSV